MIKELLSFLGVGAGQTILVAILGLAIIIIIFLILRNVFCWYWKINKMVKLLESMEQKLAFLSSTTSIKDKQN